MKANIQLGRWYANMMSIVKVSPKYQITVPSELRESLGLQPGDKLLFHQKPNGEVVIHRVPQVSAQQLAGSLARASGKTIPYVPIEEARRITYDELGHRMMSELQHTDSPSSIDGGDAK
ncbi:AbrB/MazE/SpoVT family DNA-binding domain-containing protein [Alicyclobacillus sacchari]|uniref:AbrB/MazE/SpoVT family DNA-binding domain-containing protein n=1 Tax=Alicyclobacillus sacchari TaxID=392010 RepID=UPI001AB0282B|nr:AbrB/MazE/SpoVT family DNA-binding domain-containing protein [Alicyclobacillus sacchari]